MAKNEKKNEEVLEKVNEEVLEKVNEEVVAEEKVVTEADIDRMAKEAGEKIKLEGQREIKIPKDPLNPKDGVVPVCINGYFYQIKRGEKVKVPESVADVLENAGYI